jgi:hypothetical protein
MKDTAKSAADRPPDPPSGRWSPKAAPESEDYASAVSEGWPVAPDPRRPEPGEAR